MARLRLTLPRRRDPVAVEAEDLRWAEEAAALANLPADMPERIQVQLRGVLRQVAFDARREYRQRRRSRRHNLWFAIAWLAIGNFQLLAAYHAEGPTAVPILVSGGLFFFLAGTNIERWGGR